MFLLLITLATKNLEEIVDADIYFDIEYTIEETFELGSVKNTVIINDYCTSGDDLYLVGGSVRLGDYKGGMDALIIKYNNGVEWMKVFGGSRDDVFESIDCQNEIGIVGTSYSVDFIADSWNFKNGFIMTMTDEGVESSLNRLDYPLDITPTGILWHDGWIIGGYLDNFGNKDIFLIQDKLEIFEFSGLDKMYDIRFENELIGVGSSTSKEMGANNINAVVYFFNPFRYEIYNSNTMSELTNASNQITGYVGEEGLEYDNEYIKKERLDYIYTDERVKVMNQFGVLQITDSITINEDPISYDSIEEVNIEHQGEYIRYSRIIVDDVILYTAYKEIGVMVNNVKKSEYYNSFTLLFTGVATLNGEKAVTGELLNVGRYRFKHYEEEINFEVLSSDLSFRFIDLEEDVPSYSQVTEFNTKLMILPILVISNLLYKKYQ